MQATDARWRPDLITGVCYSRSAPSVPHHQADGDAGDHALPVAASGRGGVGRVAALVMSAGKSVDFTGIGGPQRNGPSAGGKLEPSSWSYAEAARHDSRTGHAANRSPGG